MNYDDGMEYNPWNDFSISDSERVRRLAELAEMKRQEHASNQEGKQDSPQHAE
jgi:hypothetical protein